MQFVYCPGCKDIQPRRWLGSKRCPSCLGEARVIKVKTGTYGYLAIITSLIALVLAVVLSFDLQTPLADSVVYAFLFTLVLAFALTFMETGRAKKRAEVMMFDAQRSSRD